MTEPLAKYVKPRVDRARLARQWAAIVSGERKGASWRRPSWVWAGLVLAAAALVWAVGPWWHSAAPPVAGAGARGRSVVSAIARADTTTIALDDGSEITLLGGARLAFGKGADMDLLAGSADFVVKHDASRPFVVRAGAVRIVDAGTRFHVDYTNPGVRVSVSEGIVRVERDGREPSELRAGESLSTDATGAAAPPDSIASTTAPPFASSNVEPSLRDASAAASNGNGADTDGQLLARFAAEPDPERAFDIVRDAFPRVLGRATPKQLFALGDAARLSGHAREAALAFDALRTHHRSDPRAGLAAMELGRIRQDVLHDISGAEEAYRDALALAPDSPFREDAEARRVEVLEAAHNVDECRKARDAYLGHWPAGIHAAAVSRRCGGGGT